MVFLKILPIANMVGFPRAGHICSGNLTMIRKTGSTDILLGDCPNDDSFTISFTITQQRPLNTQSIIIESVIVSFSICILNNISKPIIEYFR